MALPANDLFPKHDELTSRELSIEELDAIAAGNWLGDAWRWVKNEVKGYVNDKINEYETVGGAVLSAGRSIIHMF